MTTSRFDQRVLIEQLRYIEAQEMLVGDADETHMEVSSKHDFDSRLWHRAERLVEQNELGPKLKRAATLARIATVVALLVAAILGGLATSYAVHASETINIYWLLLVLLGFNLLSMLLWLVGISLNIEVLTAGVIAKLSNWLPARFIGTGKPTGEADRAWLASHFGGRVGKWQFSKLTHQLWLVYLMAGLSILVLLLMARQYDFVWGTTLLSDGAFVHLTELLGKPLHALGLSTPSPQQIQETRIGAEESLSAEHRKAWAQFLLGSLVCFGILPRLILLFWSKIMHHVAENKFSLDYYLPYYIGLRQQLMPLAGHGEIVDADPNPPVVATTNLRRPESQHLPAETRWAAVELGSDIDWPIAAVAQSKDMGQVVDRDSLTRIQKNLQAKSAANLAIAVAAARTPDRGIKRTIASLLEESGPAWLVLLHKNSAGGISDARLEAWYRIAEACDMPADHVISMGLD